MRLAPFFAGVAGMSDLPRSGGRVWQGTGDRGQKARSLAARKGRGYPLRAKTGAGDRRPSPLRLSAMLISSTNSSH